MIPERDATSRRDADLLFFRRFQSALFLPVWSSGGNISFQFVKRQVLMVKDPFLSILQMADFGLIHAGA